MIAVKNAFSYTQYQGCCSRYHSMHRRVKFLWGLSVPNSSHWDLWMIQSNRDMIYRQNKVLNVLKTTLFQMEVGNRSVGWERGYVVSYHHSYYLSFRDDHTHLLLLFDPQLLQLSSLFCLQALYLDHVLHLQPLLQLSQLPLLLSPQSQQLSLKTMLQFLLLLLQLLPVCNTESWNTAFVSLFEFRSFNKANLFQTTPQLI